MRKNGKKMLSLALALMMVLALLPTTALAASDFTIENAVLKKYNGSGGNVVIPNSVIAIGDSAFEDCKSLTSVVIPDGVTRIGDYAFRLCENLISVVIPSSVTSIGDGAFRVCRSLTSVTIPSGVTSIGDLAFGGCESLTSVVIPDTVTEIGSFAFSGCSKLTSVTLPTGVKIGASAFSYTPWRESQGDFLTIDGVLLDYDGKDKEVVIPSGVTRIGNEAFWDCKNLTSVVIPDTVTEIGEYAFYNCDGLTSVTIPYGVTSIEGFAFYDCDGLTSVTIPASVTSIGQEAFFGCKALTNVYYGGSEAQWKAIAISAESWEYTGKGYRDPSFVAQYGCNKPLLNATIHYSAAPATPTAKASNQTVQVDGKSVEFQMYALVDANGNETNYIKLRDLAYILNGTEAQFEVSWDSATGNINLLPGNAYTNVGSEMNTPFSGNRAYQTSTAAVLVNGAAVSLAGITLTDDAGSAYNYYKLRDLGQALGFNVTWNGSSIVVESDQPYTG